MKPSYMLSKEIARKMILVHPPEPRKDLLLSQPSQGVYIGKTRFLRTPVFWDPSKLINPHLAIIGITGSGKSYTVKTFLTRASLIWNTNAIILDWVGEYNEWVKQAGGRVINLAKERLNILDLVGLPKRSRIKQIISALEILVELKSYPNERDEIEEALEYVYYKMGSQKPTMGETLKVMEEERTVKRKKGRLNKKDVGEALDELCCQGKCDKPTLSHVVRILEKTGKKKAARLLKRFTVEGSDFFAGDSTLDIK